MKVKGIKIIIILSLLASILMPFSVFADTITTSNIVGVNTVVADSEIIGQVTYNNVSYNSFSSNYDVEIVFDQAYIGYVQLTLEYDYSTRNSSGFVTNTDNQTRRVYINGSSVHINLNIVAVGSSAPLTISYNNPRVSTVTAGSTNVIPVDSIQSLTQIVQILGDIYQSQLNIENYNQLQTDYLQALSELRQYNFPIESFTFVSALLKHHELDVQDYFKDSYYQYPIFNIQGNTEIFKFWANNNDQKIIIFYIDNNIRPSVINNYINFNYGTYTSISVYGPIYYRNSVLYCLKLVYTNNSGSSREITMSNISSSSFSFVPIYFDVYNSQNVYPVSTDFALVYRISNNLLYNLNSIAAGNNQYDQSKDDLDDDTSNFVTDSGNLIQIEENYLDDLDTSLQSIDTNTGLNIFGGNFLTSATWVRTQFDRLTYNNPFGSLIVYGMTLGLALLLLGKVML